MIKQDTIAATMKAFMATHPSVTEYPSYKALNDAAGAVHGLPAGKCQALAGPKAWAWYADETTGTWRKATDAEFKAKQEAAAGKNHGVRGSKVLSDEDRAALDAQIAALEQVANPALEPLLADLRGKQASDDAARRGSLKDRLAAATDYLGAELAVKVLEWAVTKCEAGEILEAAENA